MGRLWDLVKSIGNPIKLYNLQKQMSIYKKDIRPYSKDIYNQRGQHRYPTSLYEIENLAKKSDVLGTIHRTLRTEIFRNGFELAKAKDISDELHLSQESGEAKDSERFEILKWLENINDNNQGILDVLRELEDSYNIFDDAWMFFRYDYSFKGEEIDIDDSEVIEVLASDPKTMGLVLDNQDRPSYIDDGSMRIFVCPDHRSQTILRNDENEDKVFCSQCSKRAYPAFYVNKGGRTDIYYFEWEFVHDSRYRPSKGLGFSPVITLWQKANTLEAQDAYILDIYVGKRPPKGLLVFSSSNSDNIRKEWNKAAENAKENPNLPAVMTVENKMGNKGKVVEWIDFMRSLTDLEFTEQRNEFRRVIGAYYGVEPIFQNDTSTSGGLNNEGLQLTVTTRAAESAQVGYNTKFLRKMFEAKQITGWVMVLNPSEENDEMAKLERQSKSLENGETATRNGLTATYDSKTGEVKIEDGELQKIEVPDFGGGASMFDDDEDSTDSSDDPQGSPDTDDLVKKT